MVESLNETMSELHMEQEDDFDLEEEARMMGFKHYPAPRGPLGRGGYSARGGQPSGQQKGQQQQERGSQQRPRGGNAPIAASRWCSKAAVTATPTRQLR